MRHLTHLLTALSGVAMLTACETDGPLATTSSTMPDGVTVTADQKTLKIKGDARIVSATGDILPAVTQFRDLLGGVNNVNLNGEAQSGRREVNWDGVGAGNTNNENFPGTFFNTAPVLRGSLFTTPSGLFRISNNGYTDINLSYTGQFNTFSPARLFVARNSTITDVHFVVAGSNTPATVTGFGSVFAGVGRAHSTRIIFYDVDGNRLLTVVAPRQSDANGLSFVGAIFDSPIVARVRVISGDTPIGPDDNVKGAGQKRDIVAMDDFIYGEPHAIIN